MFTGAEGDGVGVEDETTPVGLLVAEAGPTSFDAITVTRSVMPTSLEPSVYCGPVAPATDAQLASVLSQRFHWYE